MPERLAMPLRWRKPKRIFVCSMSDLHHASVPMEFRAAVYGVALACSSLHTFLVLTKRDPRPFYAWVEREAKGYAAKASRAAKRANLGRGLWDPRVRVCVDAAENAGAISGFLADATRAGDAWPPPNLHLGASVEDRPNLSRLDAIMGCPAVLHWASFEPLLEDLGDLSPWLYPLPRLGWAVIGGESGRGARRFDIEWARSLVRQLRARGVYTFVKQLGSKPVALDYPGGYLPVSLASSKGGDLREWTAERGLADLAVREIPR